MKNLILSLIAIVVLMTAVIPTPAAAASTLQQTQAVLTFADLGLNEEMVLRGAYDSRDIRFDLPATWALQAGAELEIIASTYATGSEVQANVEGAVLEVSFNEKLQKSIPMTIGEKVVYRVPISADALISPYETGGHKISFFLDAAIDCDFDFHDTTVTIDVNSKASFPHGEASLKLDLQRLPWPIFLDRGKVIDPVTVVLPASPTAEELQASFTVMGAFGRMTNGRLPLNSITVDQLTDDIRANSHLLLVGKASGFPMFADIKLPIALGGGSFSAPELKPDDGVLQIITSPWNTNRVILMVGGNSDSSVVKASQALSTSNIQTGKTPDYSVIAQVNPYPAEGAVGAAATVSAFEDMKFSDLGYAFVQVAGIGSHWVSFEFKVPAGQMPSGDVYLDLNVSTSSLVDTDRSEGVVYVNDVQTGSVKLADEESNLVTSRVYIPAILIKTGVNKIDVVFNLLPRDACTLTTFTGMWVTIFPDSVLHLPLTAAPTAASSFNLRDLKSYPVPFTSDPSLSTTTFVMSQKDPNAWITAGKIAYDLGRQASNPVIGFHVAFDGQIPDELKSNHLVVIGQPKDLEILAEFKDAMPAYFESGSNAAVLESMQVIYRLAEDKSLGYLELFNSPWNDQAAVLGIFGTTPEGLGFAANGLLDTLIRGTLAGNFATLDRGTATVVDTRTGMGIGRIAPSLGQAVAAQENQPVSTQIPIVAAAAVQNDKQLILSGILLVLALVVVTLVIITVLRLRKKNA